MFPIEFPKHYLQEGESLNASDDMFSHVPPSPPQPILYSPFAPSPWSSGTADSDWVTNLEPPSDTQSRTTRERENSPPREGEHTNSVLFVSSFKYSLPPPIII